MARLCDLDSEQHPRHLQVLRRQAPGFGDRRKAMLQDMAILTGAQVVSDELGLKLDSVDMSVLGTAKKVIVSKDETTIVAGGGSKEDVAARVAQIRAEIANTDSDYDREKLQERLAKLAGGVAVIKVGAATEVEAKERKHRIEDAVRNAKAAIEEACCRAAVSLWSRLQPRPRAMSSSKATRQPVPRSCSAPSKPRSSRSPKTLDCPATW